MYHIDYSWKNLKENTPSWLSRRNVHLGLGVLWILLLIPAFLFWKESILFVIIMSIYANAEASFAAREGAESESEQEKTRHQVDKMLSILESHEKKGEEEGLSRVLSAIEQQKEQIMAIGNETKAALTELREAIATETDQAVEKIIAATNADAATADAIREAVADVKNIIPDAVEETDIPTNDAPVDEPAPETPVDEPVDPVDPEAPVGPEEEA